MSAHSLSRIDDQIPSFGRFTLAVKANEDGPSSPPLSPLGSERCKSSTGRQERAQAARSCILLSIWERSAALLQTSPHDVGAHTSRTKGQGARPLLAFKSARSHSLSRCSGESSHKFSLNGCALMLPSGLFSSAHGSIARCTLSRYSRCGGTSPTITRRTRHLYGPQSASRSFQTRSAPQLYLLSYTCT